MSKLVDTQFNKKFENQLLAKLDATAIDGLQNLLGYEFKDKILLAKALSHPSLKQMHDFKLYFEAQKYEFEKLEFLGDSVINFVITQALLDYYPTASEGSLAKFRNFLVSKKTLFKIATDLELSKVLLISDGERKYDGQSNINNLENALESLIAAIYLDGGLACIVSIANKIWQEYIQNVQTQLLDPKSSLQEISHKRGFGLPVYIELERIGAQNSPTFHIQVSVGENLTAIGVGKSKKEAQTIAAQNLLLLI